MCIFPWRVRCDDMKECSLETEGAAESRPRSLLDVLLVVVCVVLLIALGAMLRGDQPAIGTTSGPTSGSTARPPALPTAPPNEEDGQDGPRLMTLGFALLVVSLSVCLYTIYRLGFCCNRREYNRQRLRSGIPSVNSRLHLISGTDLPPTYDAIMLSTSGDSQPPPYFTILFHNERATTLLGARPQEAG